LNNDGKRENPLGDIVLRNNGIYLPLRNDVGMQQI
jgi:hypothetical protein